MTRDGGMLARASSGQSGLEAQARRVTAHSESIVPADPFKGTGTTMSAGPERRPWEDAGYPEFCEDVASAGNGLVLRRFSALHARTLLQLQDSIVEQEGQLKVLDDKTRADPDPARRHLGTMPEDPIEGRQIMLQEIRGQLMEYVADNLLLAHSQLRARSSASDSQVRQLKRWLLSNNRDAILPPESAFIETGVDLVPLVPQSMGLVRQFLEDHLSAKHLSQMFPAGKKAGRVSWAYYTSNRGINASLAFCGIAMAVLALVGPLWILHVLDDPTKRLGITTGFMSFSHWS